MPRFRQRHNWSKNQQNEQEKDQNTAEQCSLPDSAARKPCPIIISAFQSFQEQLDAKNDKWERLVKLSRDITIESKRIIFQLHRLTLLKDQKDKDSALQEAENRLESLINAKFYHLAKELMDEEPYQFLFPCRPGLQEFIESLTLKEYLKTGRLLSYQEIKHFLEFKDQESDKEFSVLVTREDYLLGIGDLSGELMRLAINCISAGDMEQPIKIVRFLRTLYENFASVTRPFTCGRDFLFKLEVMKRNLNKVENACYVLKLRGTEMPEHMLAHVVNCFFLQHEPDNDFKHDDSAGYIN